MTDFDKIFVPKSAVYTPPEVMDAGLQAIKDVIENERRGLGVGIPSIRDYFAPVRPGQLSVLIAQTSNYKTGTLHFLENYAAWQLQKQGRTDEVLIHISVEENIEEQALLAMGRQLGISATTLAKGEVQDWSLLRQAALHIGTVTIYRIGESLARPENFPLLTVSNMIRSIETLRSGEVTGKPLKIAGLFFDYLQAFPYDDEIRKRGKLENLRRLQVRADIDMLRHAALLFHCPVWVAVQAKQDLKGAYGDVMIPGIYDGHEAMEITARPDRVMSQWMPKMTHPLGAEIKVNGRLWFVVQENHLVIKVLKQKPGLPSGRVWLCQIDFDRNLIVPIAPGEEEYL